MPSDRFAESDVLAGPPAFLASGAASYVPGSCLTSMGDGR